MSHHRIWGLALLGLALATLPGPGAEVTGGRKAVEPVAPPLPGEVVGAMQESRFDDAIKGLDAFANDPKTKDDGKAYAALVGGVARRLAGKLDEARAVLTAAIAAAPKGRWAAKLRSELAAVEVASGHFDRAEKIAEAEAETLLDDGRKDRLAAVFRSFAGRLLNPESPTVPADPEGAHALFEQGRNLAKGAAIRAELLVAMARASKAANNPGRAIGEFQAYLSEYPKGADRAAARFELGEAQFSAGQPNPARTTWLDLARDLEKVDTKEAQDLRARALYGVARTYGMPPQDDTSLNLGVAALRRLVEAYPGHPLAVRASYQIGAAYLARGKSQEALRALSGFVEDAGKDEGDDARKVRAELVMAAQFQTGQILQGQEKFAEAIAAWQKYLARFPNGPQSADAQRAVLDTRLLIASDLLRRERYAEARAAWQAFAAENPLDGRVPQVLFEVGESFVPEKKYDDAVAAWEALAAKFPGTEPAAHGLFLIASLFENEKGDPSAAID
ncbi:MAG TPA: tetratricopeptide repeat protein, partial [Isosphaeraceae bacterium]|nr:tetratricopeptide repeat protein [Isosphaeraceae bacterium]